MELAQLLSRACSKLINTGFEVNNSFWHSKPISTPMFHTVNAYFRGYEVPAERSKLQSQLNPNLPWAEDHLKERISGIPSNPGASYKNWPYYKEERGMKEGEVFSHTYQERFWPKKANLETMETTYSNHGIRYELGDLHSLLKLLDRDPQTRQAFLPIWFPEDTGAEHGGRVPCTLGYHFMVVKGRLNITYYMRSCDIIRHFKDDVYLACRLLQEAIFALRVMGHNFDNINIGTIDIFINSLHCFAHEVPNLEKLCN